MQDTLPLGVCPAAARATPNPQDPNPLLFQRGGLQPKIEISDGETHSC